MEEDYLPFLEVTAWFSTSVPKIYKDIWVLHGGRTAPSKSAEFLFSTSADCEDTGHIHVETPTVVVFHPEWLACVVRAQCYPKDHACGPYYICPAFMKGTQVEALSYNPHHPPPLPEPKSKRKTANMHNPSTVCSCPTGPSTPTDPCLSPCGEDEHLQYLSSHLFNTQDFIRLEDCDPVTEPVCDFIPNQNGCEVRRMTRDIRSSRALQPRGAV
jgi:hypothetical protein